MELPLTDLVDLNFFSCMVHVTRLAFINACNALGLRVCKLVEW